VLLRRVVEHVKAQNWTAVALDFIIVVVGVFIGIQVANWNEARGERRLEVKYLERFYFDMVRSIDQVNKDLGWSEDRIDTQKIVLRSLREKRLKEADKQDFDRGLAFFGYVSQPSRNWQTVEELKSSGRMAILSDESLRELILRVESDYNERIQRNTFNRIDRNENRLRIQDRWQYISSDFDENGQTVILYNFDALVHDTEFLNRLSHMQSVTELNIRDQQEDLASFALLRDATVKSLGYTPIERQNDLMEEND